MKIFIDHYGNLTEADGAFALKLKERILSVKENFEINTFHDLVKDNPGDWEEKTKLGIKQADIIIPIISADYLAYITESLEEKFNQIIESKDKYLFPILYSPALWGSFNWLVKSKILPEDSKSIMEHSAFQKDKLINDLVLTLTEILIKHKKIIQVENLSSNSKLKKNTVFISHDHFDSDFAELLKIFLEKNNILSWIDAEMLKIGQDWREEIDEAISSSLAVIAIMTPEARKSEYVTYEWAFAWGKRKPIFPIMLRQTQLHPRLESLQYLDFTNRNTRPYDKLIKSIENLRQ